jgi:hypothetical protein
MKYRYPLKVECRTSNIGQEKDPGDHPYSDDDCMARHVLLHIYSWDGQHLVFQLTLPLTPGPISLAAVPSKLTMDEVNDCTRNCREVWHNTLLNRVETTYSPDQGQVNNAPFCDGWDLHDREEGWLRKVVSPLAVAGDRMFTSLFRSRKREEDPVLHEIADRLQSMSADRELVITVHSDVCFIPWWMIYTHPEQGETLDKGDGSNFKPEGFWGYRHVIEHVPTNCRLDPALCPANNTTIYGSINYDETIDKDLACERLGIRCVEPHLDYLTKLQRWTNPTRRRTKAEFQKALSDNKFRDEVIYFFCHGEGSGEQQQRDTTVAKILLSDHDPISVNDINYWRQEVPNFLPASYCVHQCMPRWTSDPVLL